MILYNNVLGKLKEIEEKSFKLERDIQKIFEANLYLVKGLELVRSEFTIKNKRIDTLAFDKASGAFIIIEYKRDKNISVVDQGFTYLSLMFENKADFIVEYNETLKQHLKREDVDWSQTRVVFVSTNFTDNQIQATNFKDIAIELWEVKQYKNDTILISQLKKSNAAETIKPLTNNKESLKKVIDEIKVYSEEEHIETASEFIADLYEKFKSAILNLSDGFEIIPKKYYIAFKKGKNITDIVIQKNALKIFINLKEGQLDDTKKMVEDISKKGIGGMETTESWYKMTIT